MNQGWMSSGRGGESMGEKCPGVQQRLLQNYHAHSAVGPGADIMLKYTAYMEGATWDAPSGLSRE